MRLFKPLLVFLALAASPASAQDRPGFSALLDGLVTLNPEAVFERGRDMPPAFREYLAASGHEFQEGRVLGVDARAHPLNVRQVQMLYGGFLRGLPEPSESGGNRSAPDFVPRANAALARLREVDFDGEKSGKRRGLRIMGIQLGGTDEVPEEGEPFLSKGFEDLLDWDVSLRLKTDAYGVRARYRNPRFIRRLSVSHLQYADVRGLVLEDSAAPKSGFETAVDAQLTDRWGVSPRYRSIEGSVGGGPYERRTAAVSVGYSPYGRNAGRPWNMAYIATVTRDELTTREGAQRGFIYSAGLAYQRALRGVPLLRLNARPNAGFLRPDRLLAHMSVSESEIEGLSATASIGVTAFIWKYLELQPGVRGVWREEPNALLGQEEYAVTPYVKVALRRARRP